MSFVSSGDHTGSPTNSQQSALIVGVNLLCPSGPVVGELILPRLLADILQGIIGRLSLDQDNAPKRTLQEIVETPEFVQRKSENRRIGRLVASETRRRRRMLGEDREVAMRAAAELHCRSFSEAEILVKLHNRNCGLRIDRFRFAIITRGKRAGVTNKQIAERLRLTPQHVGRIIAEMEGKESQ